MPSSALRLLKSQARATDMPWPDDIKLQTPERATQQGAACARATDPGL